MTDTFEGMMLRSAQPLSTLTLLDGRGEVAVTITFDPPHIDLAPHIDWDSAAKTFWKACALLVGQPPPFL